jgi:polar amino acid transport system substrate-binding protein
MRTHVRLLSICVLLATSAAVQAQSTPDPRVADLVRAGTIRVALFLPMYTKDPATGELRGVGPGAVNIEMARALGARLGVKVVLVENPTPVKAVECLAEGNCDVGFMGNESSRAAVIYSPPFMELDYTYLVPAGSPIRAIGDADRQGVRIAVVRKHASTLTLERILNHGEMVGADVPDAAFELLRTGRADAFASVRSVLLDYSARLPGSRVLEDRYGANRVAMAVRKDEAGRLTYLSEFVNEAKTSGLVQRAIDESGMRGARVSQP